MPASVRFRQSVITKQSSFKVIGSADANVSSISSFTNFRDLSTTLLPVVYRAKTH